MNANDRWWSLVPPDLTFPANWLKSDLILVMDEGSLVECDNHQRLLEQGGFYAELYNSQFENGRHDLVEEVPMLERA